MSLLRILCGSALIASALMLAACDDAAGPALSNDEIIAQMKDARSRGVSPALRSDLLRVAIGALTAGSQATLGRLVIDGESHPFTFTGMSMVRQGSDGSEEWTTFVIGWRHPDGDSLVAMVYYENDIGAMTRTPGLAISRLGGSDSALGDIARKIYGGQGSVSTVAVPGLDLQEAVIYLGDVVALALGEGEGITGGSVAMSDASVECANIDSEDFLASVNGTVVGCELRRLSVDGGVDFLPNKSRDHTERVINLPSLTLVGPVVVYR